MGPITSNRLPAIDSIPSPPRPRRAGWWPGPGGLAATALALISTLHYLGVPGGAPIRGVVHVAPEGWDGFSGASRRLAVRSLQRAADLAEPGTTILLWPGVWRESVHLRRGGRPGRPLVLRAALPGKAVISGAAEPGVMAAWRWQPLGGTLWTTPVAWRVDGLRWRGVAAYRSRSLAQLRRICGRPGAWPAFASTANRLWLCLPDGQRPRLEGLQVRRPMPRRLSSGGHQVASLWIEAPHVVVRDLRFDFAVMAAIQLWNTHDVLLEGNHFADADVAINDNPSLQTPSRITVRRNFSTCRPLFEWRRHGWLSWKEVYSYSNCSLVWLHGRDIVVERNGIFQAGDGIKLSPTGGSNRANHNLIVETTDDAFEFDGPARHLSVSDNLIVNPFVALAPSPVTAGPVLLLRNTVLQCPSSAPSAAGALIKLMGGPSRSVSLRENGFVGWRIAFGQADSPVRDMTIDANGFATLAPPLEGLDRAAQIQWRDNRFLRLTPARWRDAERHPAVVAAIGVRPVALGPVGPPWMVLDRDPATAAAGPFLRGPWRIR
ncbi:MAG: hypothetical protein ACK587_17015 [Cyanobacteriota bacterium]